MALILLREAGHNVQGVTMLLWPPQGGETAPLPEAAQAARDLCSQLGVQHTLIDLRETFAEAVVNSFVREYAQARTPNPCVRCNERVKFGALLEAVKGLGATGLATGHHAQVGRSGGGYTLCRGVDAAKDQSYFLYTLSQRVLSQVCFPVGTYTKDVLRAMAAERGLSVAQQQESQDACFVGAGSYADLLRQRVPEALRPGPILNRQGRILGQHLGLPLYTVGQRSGLGVSADRPLYVLRMDRCRNALIVGYAEELDCHSLVAREMHYVSGEAPECTRYLQAQIRYRAQAVEVRVEPSGSSEAAIYFEQPVRGAAPGQAIVLYEGCRVVGGGLIDQVESVIEP